MTKIEYMVELEGLLLDISAVEREEALQYYSDYFEDAGPDNIERIMEHLGPPEKIAEIIKSELNYSEEEKGESKIYTETGYKDMSIKEDRYEVVKDLEFAEETEDANEPFQQERSDEDFFQGFEEKKSTYTNEEEAKEWKSSKKTGGLLSKIMLIILFCIFVIPVGIPVVAVIFSFALTIAVLIIMFFLFFLGLTITFCLLGICLILWGLYQLFVFPVNGMLSCGVGLLLLGFGLIFSTITVWICTKAMPAVIKGFINLCKIPFSKKEHAKSY